MMLPTSGRLNVKQEEVVSDDTCAASDASLNVVAIAWASEDTGALHLNISHHEVDKNACIEFELVNADIETDGTWADHDFDFPADLNKDTGMADFHQEFFRNETVRHLFVQMPNQDTTLTLICGVPGHKAAGMMTYIDVGAGSPKPSDTASSPFPFMAFGIFFLGFAVATVQLRKFKTKNL